MNWTDSEASSLDAFWRTLAECSHRQTLGVLDEVAFRVFRGRPTELFQKHPRTYTVEARDTIRPVVPKAQRRPDVSLTTAVDWSTERAAHLPD